MARTFDQHRDDIAELAKRFAASREAYHAPGYKEAHDRMVSLVERMLELHRQLAGCKGECDKPALERLIASTDAEIDRLVYELYGLTEDEIRIVEAGRG